MNLKIKFIALSIAFIMLTGLVKASGSIHYVKAFQELASGKSADYIFKLEVLENKKPVIVKFFAEWCGPCQSTKSILEKVANEFKDKVTFIEIDTDIYRNLTQNYNILSLPTFIYFLNGEEKGRLVGYKNGSELKAKINEYFKI